MALATFILTASLYSVVCCLFLANLAAERGAQFGAIAKKALVVALVVHAVYGVTIALQNGQLWSNNIYSMLNFASFLVAAGFLAALARYPVTILGGFVLPVTLLFFLGSGLGTTTVTVSSEVRSTLLPLHIAVNVLGIVSFALAFSVAVAYLIQERLLRQKKIGGLFRRLPALDRLDVLANRLVAIGFVLLTAGIVSGVFWLVRGEAHGPGLSLTQALAIVSWLVFGGVLVMRRAAGWRGQRAAIGTLVGFALTTAVLAGYLLRAGSVG